MPSRSCASRASARSSPATLGCCRFRGFEDLADRRRQHYLWMRNAEVAEVATQPSRDLRFEQVSQHLVLARATAAMVRRSLEARAIEAPDFEHLERWGSVLTRLSSAPVGVR